MLACDDEMTLLIFNFMTHMIVMGLYGVGQVGNFRVDDELLESIYSRLNASNAPTWSTDNSIAARVTRGFSDAHFSSPRTTSDPSAATGPSLRKVSVALDEEALWDSVLLQTCLRKLFPNAVSSSSVLDESWMIPPNHDDSVGLKRAIFLAKVKVFSHKQRLEGITRLERKLSSLPPEKLESLRAAILSIHGIFTIDTQSQSDRMVVVEACAGQVIVRQLASAGDAFADEVRDSYGNALVVHGLFDDEHVRLIGDLLHHCERYKLLPVPELTKRDVPTHKKNELQSSCLTEPLPVGWFFDGQHFIDYDGNKSSLRPDIDDIVERYLTTKNASVREYNQILNEVNKFI